jgi:hypothetical protein
VDVGQRFVGVALAHAVGRGQVLELERGRAVLALRPHDAFRAQRVRQAHRVEQVPPAVAAAPLALVRVVEVAEQPVADEFVVEAQRVPAQVQVSGRDSSSAMRAKPRPR